MPISGPQLDAPADLSGLLGRGLALRPDELAVASHGERMTWRELDAATTRFARHLLDLGLRPDDRIASLMPNRPALLVFYLACMKAGFVATPLNYRYQPPEMDHALAVSGASTILAHAERAQDLAESREVAKLPVAPISYGGSIGTSLRYEHLLDTEPPPSELPRPKLDAPAFIFFTSGSTGPPKGVTHSQRTFGWIAASLARALELTADDVVLPGSSMSHIGSSKLALAGLSVGAPLGIARTSDGDELLELLRETRPTVALVLPAALFSLIRDHGARHDDFRSLRFVMSAGDRVPAELEKEFTDIVGSSIHEGYGMTEIGTSHLNPPSGPNKLGSVGTNNPRYDSSIRDEQGREVAADAEGRHWVAGPAVMTGYWENTEATANTVLDGWLDTGDIMKADEDEYLWFRGRKKQIIVHDSSNINPEDVEDAIASHPAVASVGVVGVHDLMHGENVWAYITLREDADRPTSQDIIRFARDRVGYKAPEVIVVIDEMPLNATGKVDRRALKGMAADRVGAVRPD
jgi:acyl-CoA synthetase (AMP-forming)/AMP-acid ligase II